MLIIRENTQGRIQDSGSAVKIMAEIFNQRDPGLAHRECFYSIGMNAKHEILYIELCAVGTVNQAVPFIREILRTAILKNAVSIIVSHNHPSGDPAPSAQDNKFTEELKAGSRILGINLLDHLILGDNYYSYADQGGI